MSSLLFLSSVGGFVLIAYWAFRNDAMQAHECGSGLLAMSLTQASAPKSAPKWKKSGMLDAPRRLSGRATALAKPLWQRSFLYGSAR
jgi:hypothetical protein